MITRTITRLARPLRGASPHKRIAYSVPRPEGWTEVFRDYAKWRMMLRREGRNEAEYRSGQQFRIILNKN